jgi:hypothetical protein
MENLQEGIFYKSGSGFFFRITVESNSAAAAQAP